MSIELSILTLNIWGIPWVSTDREHRVYAIAEQLTLNDYDVVALQEVWSQHDFEFIRDRLAKTMPYSHYFHSGVLGSGLCMFSVHPIVGTLFHTWPVNGYMHRVHHGDWFGGKGVGLCRLDVHSRPVHVYVAHLHAEYDRENDDYKAHRVIQAFDTAQFIESTRGNAVLQVLAGDLNTEPGDLAYRTLLSVAQLHDACSLPAAGTNECPHNVYTSAASRAKLPVGRRIDYLLYRGEESATIATDYSFPFPRELATRGGEGEGGALISYSDHEAVLVRFWVHTQTATTTQGDDEAVAAETEAEADARAAEHEAGKKVHVERLRNDLSDCIYLCDETLKLLRTHRTFYLALALAVLVVLMTIMDATTTFGSGALFVVVRLVLCAVLVFAVVMGTLWNWIETNGVMGGRAAMNAALEHLVEYYF